MYYESIEAFYHDYRREMERLAQRMEKSYARNILNSLESMRLAIINLPPSRREQIERHLRFSDLRYDQVRSYMVEACRQWEAESASATALCPA